MDGNSETGDEHEYCISNLTKIITSILKEIIDEECKDCK